MANWAKLQEDLTDLPVYKRAKHGIHFDKGNGQIEAHFSGKPCHYQDTDGLWKPIDTRLLLGADGFYGCPHLPVKVHQDGRVKVTGSDYSQFTKLPGSPLGRVDGDKIVREFPGGYQELFVTEDGFREVITVVKPTFPIEKFLAKQSGTLPSAYKAHAQTAVDANGDVFEITSDTKAFGDWLEGAVYPVTIDPDFAVGNTAYGDSWFNQGGSPHYNERRNYGAVTTFAMANNCNAIFRFDLSTIPASATCAAVVFKPTKTAGTSANNRTYYIYSLAAANTDWIEGTQSGSQALSGEPCYAARKADGAGGVTEAWAGSAGCNTSGTDYEATALMSVTQNATASNPTQYEWTFNAAGIARVEDWFGGITNNYGMMIKANAYGESTFAFSEYATESYRPVLSVTYTTGGALRRINTSSFQQLTGGIHG